jgi:adenosylhomocysteinase
VDYHVKDIKLAPQGELNIAWAKSQMGALVKVQERFFKEKPLKGIVIGMALHVTKETAVLVETLQAGGAEVAITGCNPLSTQDDVAAALAKNGVKVYGWKGENTEEYYANLEAIVGHLRKGLAGGKRIATIDDGCDLVTLIHQKHADLIPQLVVGTEETTTGVIRLRAMEKDGALKCTVIAVNDNQTKHLFDNYYGTGQSTIDGILRATSILLAGKRVVVAGYGHCGRGVAKCARGMGALVTVTEVDEVKALQARMDGFESMPMKECAPIGDVFVTVTGDKHVITTEIMKLMKNGAIMCNSGHFDIEIDTAGLYKMAKKRVKVRPFMEQFELDNGKKIALLAEGRLVNLAAAEGHPSEVMSLSFCGQALAVEYGVKHKGNLPAAVISLPTDVDHDIAALQMTAMGLTKDNLTSDQIAYLSSWQEGT